MTIKREPHNTYVGQLVGNAGKSPEVQPDLGEEQTEFNQFDPEEFRTFSTYPLRILAGSLVSSYLPKHI